MTDDEILAYYRAKHHDPYMPLSMAKKMQHGERKWAGMSSKKKAPDPERCRYGDGTCLAHRRTP